MESDKRFQAPAFPQGCMEFALCLILGNCKVLLGLAVMRVSHLQLGLAGSQELLFCRVLVCLRSGEGAQQVGIVYSYPQLRFLIGLHSMHLFVPACGHYVANNKAIGCVEVGVRSWRFSLSSYP